MLNFYFQIRFFTISWFLLIVVLFSCRKESQDNNHITESKIVIDYASGRPIAGLKIYIGKQYLSFRVTNEPWNFLGADTLLEPPALLNNIDSVFTDINGRFSYTYTQVFDSLENLYIRNGPILPPEYLQVNKIVRVIGGTYQTDTIYADKAAILNLSINKIAPVGLTDTLYENIEFTSRNIPRGQAPSYLKAQVGKQAISVKHIFHKSFYETAYITWRLYNGGLQSFGEDSIPLSSSGFTNLNIQY